MGGGQVTGRVSGRLPHASSTFPSFPLPPFLCFVKPLIPSGFTF